MSAKLLVVTRCSACPFFEDSTSRIFGLLAPLASSQGGLCNLLPSGEFLPSTDIVIGLPPGPEREAMEPRYAKARSRRFIEDKRTIPADCPLRRNDWTVTLARDN
jgi:hypothetical protein